MPCHFRDNRITARLYDQKQLAEEQRQQQYRN